MASISLRHASPIRLLKMVALSSGRRRMTRRVSSGAPWASLKVKVAAYCKSQRGKV